MNIQAIKAANQRYMYHHRATVERAVETTKPTGGIKESWAPVEGLESMPCKLSQGKRDNAEEQGPAAKTIKEAYTLFCDPEADVRANDRITIDGKTYLSGEPFRYPTHQEITLVRRDFA
ncbi:hypothetical protein SDC9_195691 [bioreactor metagenome]|uniref:Uncharacterized protein n=1 Tax=bioreactor metagenome TaxID=1076179 RepID=A0A645I9S2_9ZZZZ